MISYVTKRVTAVTEGFFMFSVSFVTFNLAFAGLKERTWKI